MISRKTLFEKSSVYVQSIGPRADPSGRWFGFYLTMRELRLYAGSMKFNPTNRTVPNYVKDWVFCDWVHTVGDIYDLEEMDGAMIWFRIPATMTTQVMIEAEHNGFPAERVITDFDKLVIA